MFYEKIIIKMKTAEEENCFHEIQKGGFYHGRLEDNMKKKIALFAGGTLFGTAGVKILASDDAKKVYTQCTAAVLRAKDCVMKTVTTVQENAGDIYEDAKTINEERAAAKEAAVVEDAEKAEEVVEEASEPAEA